MSWVKYTKGAQKHEAAKKTKKMLLEMINEMNLDVYLSDFSIFMEITGIKKNDERQIRFYIDGGFKALHRDIGKDIAANEECYDGYYTSNYLKRITVIKKLEEISSYIRGNYHYFEI